MSLPVLFHHVAKHHLHASVRRLSILTARRLSSNVEPDEQKKEEKTETTLVYNPSAYYQRRTVRSSITACSETEEGSRDRPLNSAFRQQHKWNSISSSRELSSTKNILLDRAFNRDENKQRVSKRTKDTKIHTDPRAFQKCRLEYRTMTLAVSQRSSALDLSQALFILDEVAMLKHNMGASEITGFLCELSQIPLEHATVVRKDPRFNMLLRHSIEILPSFSPAQLLDVLNAFVHLDVPNNNSLLALYEAEFCQRADEMELHQLLLAADTWRCLGRYVPQFLERLYDSVGPNLSRMTPAELVQLLYVIGESRRAPEALVQPIESLLLRHLSELKPEELSAVCLGLFKSQMTLSSRSIQWLVNRTLDVLEDLSDFAIANVMKLMRFHHLDHLPWLEAMGLEIPRRAPQMKVQGLMHVVLSCSSLHYRDEHVLLAVAEQLPNVVEQCRSKDAAKLLWAFGTLGVVPEQCPDLYPCLTEILRERQEEFQRYPEHLLTGLLGLAFIGMFPEDLLHLALSPEFVSKASKSQEFELKKDLFTLDETVALELPESTIPRLSHAIREEVTRQLWDFAQTDICQKPEMLEAESVLCRLLGGNLFVRKHMILPHLRSVDLEVHLDQNDQALPVFPQNPSSQSWEQQPSGVSLTDDLLAQLTSTQKNPFQPSNKPFQKPVTHRIKPVRDRESVFKVGIDLTDDLVLAMTKTRKRSSHLNDSKASVQRLAVQVTNRNQYCYRTEQLLGLHALKRRHLALAGYKVVELPHWEWLPLQRRSLAEKLAYMHCKIFSSANSRQSN